MTPSHPRLTSEDGCTFFSVSDCFQHLDDSSTTKIKANLNGFSESMEKSIVYSALIGMTDKHISPGIQ